LMAHRIFVVPASPSTLCLKKNSRFVAI